MDDSINITTETATLGNGCFWCTEAIFQLLKGVKSITSGYSGGDTTDPDYKSVCTGNTGHAECLNIIYDPSIVTFEDLLEVFWKTHDPTTLNRQGNDIGTQYRSVVFYHNESQQTIAQEYIDQLNKSGSLSKSIVTTLEKFKKFYPAENYHHNYFKQNANAPYCQFVVKPKVDKFLKNYPTKLKAY